MAKLGRLLEIFEEIAPHAWAESWDNCGLQIGEPGLEVRGILVALELNDDVIDEAKLLGANLIVTHHPFIFKALSSIRTDYYTGRIVRRLLVEDMALFVMHTNYDRAPEGMNAFLARQLGIADAKPLEQSKDTMNKLVVFVPAGHEGTVREAIFRAGAGRTGHYSHTAFQMQGQGSFLPEEGTRPFIGEPGKMQFVDELRIETIFPSVLRSQIIGAMLEAHPYEEVAYDIYPLAEPSGLEGLGKVGRLTSPMPWLDFLLMVKAVFRKAQLPVGGEPPPETIRKIAVTSGAGAGLMEAAAFQGADVYLTGDLKHHEFRRGEELGLTLVDIGHYASEVLGMTHLAKTIEHVLCERNLPIPSAISKVDKDSYTLA